MVELDQELELAKRWVLQQCDPTGRPVEKVELSHENLPGGLTRALASQAFEELKREERVSGRLVRSDNAGWTICRLVCWRQHTD